MNRIKKRRGEVFSGLISIPLFLSMLNSSSSQFKSIKIKNIYIRLNEVYFIKKYFIFFFFYNYFHLFIKFIFLFSIYLEC
jgi:hypothetical protein